MVALVDIIGARTMFKISIKKIKIHNLLTVKDLNLSVSYVYNDMYYLKEELIMAVREGAVPVTLGAVVTGVGAVMVSMEMMPMIAAGVVGFGAAHILLGAIDLVSDKNGNRAPSRA